MVRVVEFCLEGSATLVAVRVTLGAEGRMAGAVKFPLASTMPQLLGQAGPERLQRMAGSGLPLLATEARKD